jgi:hypothetical protein
VRLALALVLLLAACGGDDGGVAAGPDAAIADDGGVCMPLDSRICSEGNSVWIDSCGNLGELAEECLDAVCEDARGLCCVYQGATDLFAGQPWTTSLDLTHQAGTEASWTLDLEQVDYVESARGQILFWRIPVDGGYARFGFATHIFQPATVDYGAFGLYWIAEGVDDLADSEPAAGATETLQGIGTTIRYNLPRTDHQSIALRLVREEADGEGDWFGLYASVDGEAEFEVGRARFDRSNPAARATLASFSTVSLQVGKVEPAEFSVLDLPTFRVAIGRPAIGGTSATSASVRYGTVSSPPFVASEVTYREDDQQLVFAHGMGVGRCADPGPIY